MSYRLASLIGVLLFLVSFVAVAQPGQAQAALTLNNFVGFETNGTDEALGASGTAISTTAHSGDWSLEMDNTLDTYDIAMITGGSTDSDNDFILGFYIRWTSSVPIASNNIRAFDDSSNSIWVLQHQTDGDITLYDANGSSVVTTTTTPLSSTGVWHLIEIRWQHSASGAFDVHVNGTSEISETGVDLTDGGAISADSALYRVAGSGGASNPILYDDFYAYSGATGTGDFLGNAEVFRYQANTNSATADTACTGLSASGLNAGVWQDLGETPLSPDATEPKFTGGSVNSGVIYTDDTQSGNNYRPGPSGDSNIDGDTNIKGAKWLHRLRRGNGSSTTHRSCWGNTTNLSQTTLDLSTSYSNYFTMRTSSEVPDSGEHCAHGFANANGGGREIFSEEIWCFVLHVPGAAPTPRRIFTIDSIASTLQGWFE